MSSMKFLLFVSHQVLSSVTAAGMNQDTFPVCSPWKSVTFPFVSLFRG